jgi:hypothetical protein
MTDETSEVMYAGPLPTFGEDDLATKELLRRLEEATLRLENEARNMKRVRIYVGWAGVVMAAAATAALPLNETLTQWVTGVLQVVCWSGVALMNLWRRTVVR